MMPIYSYAQPQTDSSRYPQVEIILTTKSGNIHGSLMTPEKFISGNIVLIIAGSGPTDRDGNNMFMKNNSLLQLAEGLAANGIASVRFDKRGIAMSEKAMTKEEDIRFEHYIDDVKDWVQLIRKDKRFKKVIIAGHSEGSLIGMVAAQGVVDKYISLAGPGEPIGETLKRQLDQQLPKMKDRCHSIIDSLNHGIIVDNVPAILQSVFRSSVQPYMISWMRYNPQIEIKKLTMPLLIIQGDKDLQVTVADAELLHQQQTSAAYHIVSDMNHVFKTVSDNKDNYKSYGEPNRPISAEMISIITDFINKK